ADKFPGNGKDSRWRYSVATQARIFQRGSGSNQYLLRGSLGYDLKPGMTLSAGFDYFLTDPDGGSERYERRPWQQFSWAARKWDWGALSLRWRLEERDLENASDTGLRFRQMAQLALPVQHKNVTAILSVEHFQNLNDTDAGARSGFDQLRGYAGLRLPIGNKTSLEAGYMHQHINRPNGIEFVNHTGMLHLRVKLR
ncbi:MAG: DUF2490 domain-containing protein, partial [Woeseia sp.]|nr:DUF2490 domain-containing protein [Woeseia sp.]